MDGNPDTWVTDSLAGDRPISLGANIRKGLNVGVSIAISFSFIAIIGYAIGGSEVASKVGTSIWGLLAAYFGGGLTAGAVGGIMLPLVRWAWGAALVGAIAGMIMDISIRIAQGGLSFWSPFDPFVLAFFALVGAGIALYLRWFPPKVRGLPGDRR